MPTAQPRSQSHSAANSNSRSTGSTCAQAVAIRWGRHRSSARCPPACAVPPRAGWARCSSCRRMNRGGAARSNNAQKRLRIPTHCPASNSRPHRARPHHPGAPAPWPDPNRSHVGVQGPKSGQRFGDEGRSRRQSQAGPAGRSSSAAAVRSTGRADVAMGRAAPNRLAFDAGAGEALPSRSTRTRRPRNSAASRLVPGRPRQASRSLPAAADLRSRAHRARAQCPSQASQATGRPLDSTGSRDALDTANRLRRSRLTDPHSAHARPAATPPDRRTSSIKPSHGRIDASTSAGSRRDRSTGR